MSRGTKPGDRGGARLPDGSGYEVGYGKPPTHSRFRKGQSGNPRGRPKGAKNRRPRLHEERLRDIIQEEAYRMIKVRDGTKEVDVPMAQAIVRALAVNAAKGQQRAQKLFTELLSTTERDNRRLQAEVLQAAVDYKTKWERELERRERTGTTGPEPIPHPDDIRIDPYTGEVHVTGPITREQKRRRDWLREQKATHREQLRLLEAELDNAEEDLKPLLRQDISHSEKILDIILSVEPD